MFERHGSSSFLFWMISDCKNEDNCVATLILLWIIQFPTFQRLLCLLRFHRSWLCPEARFSPMHPLRLPICPKSFRTACLFQPRKLNFVLLSFFEGDKSINERLFTQLYFKLFSIICQIILNSCKNQISRNLKTNFWKNRTAKSGYRSNYTHPSITALWNRWYIMSFRCWFFYYFKQ